MSFTAGMPESGSSLGNTRTKFVNNFSTIRTAIQANHENISNAGAGKHRFIQLMNVSPGTTSATELGLFNGTNNRLFLRPESNGNTIQMSGINPVSATNGYTFLPGGILMQWGTTASSSNATVDILFATDGVDFDATPYNIQVTGLRLQANPGNSDSWVITDTPPSATGFTIKNNGGHTFAFMWLAIGPKA